MTARGLITPVGNPAWPSDNWYGVPTLDLSMQATRLELPLVPWSREQRKSRVRSTWSFYVDDYRFSALWSKPQNMLASGAVAAIEPNFSVHAQTPRALAIYQTYRKRWLARYWQDHGIRIIADLNVDPVHEEINHLGIPHGWGAFATRGKPDRLDDLRHELTMAKTIAGRESVLFICVGGGRVVEEECRSLGVIWLPAEVRV